jgi:streptogramin lyase
LAALSGVLAGAAPAAAVRPQPGDILVADGNAFEGYQGGVIGVDPDTGAQTEISSGGSFRNPHGIALEADRDILVLDIGTVEVTGAVIRIDPASGAQTTVSSGGSFIAPDGIGLEADGNIVVADQINVTVVRVDPDTGEQTPISGGGSFEIPHGIAVVPPASKPRRSCGIGAELVVLLPALGWLRRRRRSDSLPQPRRLEPKSGAAGAPGG